MIGIIESFTWLTLCIYFEARSQDIEGMKYVGHIVINRVRKEKKSVKEVVLRPYQFSWTNKNDPQGRIINDLDALYRAAEAATLVAEERLMGRDFFGVDHYFNWKQVSPSWKNSMVLVKRHGDHEFYRAK